ncbi:DUF6711 family protein [Ligilactobacillus salivarius]|uniref:DUF6711 family protein n=1 Tax=Ligilactobacillus salivarius TaxID=1624 RepID=UPI000BB05530|nr:DUF6711 family protein [Ligilactobacillus salivarius]PAY53506.1 hypothetical protein A8C37_04930 [Ligilactobacillus salivarius]PEH09783.1 hypothetical protein CP353_06675 [Lactobacillus sp. UMNPBX2]UXI85267.1 hypothetical protein NYZ94_05090 [Ligilactobacillus salivarius]UXI85337.1 hypothetical protein NYZ94_05450 [Ligilactobacillus salivarius]
MYYLKINGTKVKAPKEMTVLIQDIDAKATRDATGLLHRDRVATKRKITASWTPLTIQECKEILDAVQPQFFKCEYLDPMDGTINTRTFYVGDRTAPVLSFNNETQEHTWNGLQFDLIEQ